MQALTLFNQNFAVAESLLQLFQVFNGLSAQELKEELQRALIRGYDWRTERLDRSYNNDRR